MTSGQVRGGREDSTSARWRSARQALGENHPDVADSLNNLAGVYNAQGKYAEAEGLYQRALAIHEAKLGENHPNVASILNNLAILLWRSRQQRKGAAVFPQGDRRRDRPCGCEAPGAQQKEKISGLVEQRADYFRRHLANLAGGARKH